MREKVFKPKRTRDRKAEAIARLRMRWEEENPDEAWEPEKEPVVAPMFAAVEGGFQHVLDALRAHDDDEARAFVDAYEQCNQTDRKLLPVEYIAFAADVESLRLAELAQTALYLYASMQTKMLISSAMPKVTRSIIKAATDEVPITARDFATGDNIVVGHTNGDVKAMEIFGRMSGIVPVPKGAQIAIQNNFGEKEEKAEPGGAWKDSGERLREFHDMTEPKRLPSPETAPINIGGRIDHLQEETIHIIRGE